MLAVQVPLFLMLGAIACLYPEVTQVLAFAWVCWIVNRIG